jgi:hypothetical protein
MIGTKPKCFECLWQDVSNFRGITCKAFPKGIPDEILMGQPHESIREDQIGEFVYIGPEPKSKER